MAEQKVMKYSWVQFLVFLAAGTRSTHSLRLSFIVTVASGASERTDVSAPALQSIECHLL